MEKDVLNDLAARDNISAVVMTSYSSAYEWASPTETSEWIDEAVDGFADFFAQVADQGKQVVVINAVPRLNGIHGTDCLIAHPDDPLQCAQNRVDALPDDPMVAAVLQLNREDVRVINLDNQFCDTETCCPIVGKIIVSRDRSHLSSEFSEALMPWVVPGIERALAANS